MFLKYFQDSVLQAPTVGCMLVCLFSAIVGSFFVLRGRSLIGETLSHASYPGVICALIVERYFFGMQENDLVKMGFVLGGAVVSCLIGVYSIERLCRRWKVSQDAALSFVLSAFFGVGVTLLSLLQEDFPTLYRELSAYLFGQVATLRNVHVLIYAALTVGILLFVVCFFSQIKMILFDPVFSDMSGVRRKNIELFLFCGLVVAVVIGIRSCGVVLMSSMLLFPSVTARQYASGFLPLLILAAVLGIFSGFFGVVLSHELSVSFSVSYPTGPMIVVVQAFFFFVSLFVAKRSGLLFRLKRKTVFALKCEKENCLKLFYKECERRRVTELSFRALSERMGRGFFLYFTLYLLERQGHIRKTAQGYALTTSGLFFARKIIRLHRLWEVYLVECCKVPKDRVHASAEEMEHVLTPLMEEELDFVLDHPKKDPHAQDIPAKEVLR